MAGKIQKPYEQLQYKRGNRRARLVLLVPPEPPGAPTQRERAIAAATGALALMFGRGSARERREAPRERPKRRYRPKGERKPCQAKKDAAARRQRDERGHFVRRERPQGGPKP